MRIALLSEKYPPDPGGQAISVQRLAQMLSAAGHTVRIFALNDTPELRYVTSGTLEIFRLPLLRRSDDTLAEWFSILATQHAAQPFDVMHAYFVTALAFVAVYAGRALGVPTIVSARGNDRDRGVFDPAKSAQILYALQNADAITANSRELIRKAQALALSRSIRHRCAMLGATPAVEPRAGALRWAAQVYPGNLRRPIEARLERALAKPSKCPLYLAQRMPSL